jgi:hypothetical protein
LRVRSMKTYSVELADDEGWSGACPGFALRIA